MKDIYGLSFVIIKGCDGSLNTNYYLDHVAAAKLANVAFGMYVWLYPNNKVSIAAQVNTWVARAQADPPPLGVFIDAEWTTYSGQPANPSATDLRTAHDLFKSKYNPAITYTAKGYADQYLIGFDWSREGLWVASYGGTTPSMPKGATSYIYWQFTSTLDGKQLDPNGNFELDGNYFNGAITPPPTGEQMRYDATCIWANTMLRSTPDTTKTAISALPANTVCSGDLIVPPTTGTGQAGDQWLKVVTVNGATQAGYVAIIHLGVRYCNVVDNGATTPTTRTVTVTVKETGWTDGTATAVQSKL